MQHDLVWILRRVERIPLAPIVTDRIRKDVAIAIEIRRSDATSHFRIPLQAMLSVLVPKVESAIAARSAEGAVHWMEGDGIDRVDVAGVADRGAAVALEAEVVALVFVIHVLNSASTFDASHRESRAVREGADDACLPLQRRLDGLVEVGGIFEVDDLDPAFRGADYEHLVVAHVHAVDAVFALDACDWLRLPQVPIFDCFVPATGDEHWAVVEHNRFYAADRLIVRCDLDCVCGLCFARSQVEHFSLLVRTGAEDLLAVLSSQLASPFKPYSVISCTYRTPTTA